MSKTMRVIIDGKPVEREIDYYRRSEATHYGSASREFRRSNPVPVLHEGEVLSEYLDGTVAIIR